MKSEAPSVPVSATLHGMAIAASATSGGIPFAGLLAGSKVRALSLVRPPTPQCRKCQQPVQLAEPVQGGAVSPACLLYRLPHSPRLGDRCSPGGRCPFGGLLLLALPPPPAEDEGPAPLPPARLTGGALSEPPSGGRGRFASFPPAAPPLGGGGGGGGGGGWSRLSRLGWAVLPTTWQTRFTHFQCLRSDSTPLRRERHGAHTPQGGAEHPGHPVQIAL